MPLIWKKPQEIEIKLYFYEKKSSDGFDKIIILTNDEVKEIEKKRATDSKTKYPEIECLTTKWKKLSWELQNAISEQCSVIDNITGESHFNWIRFRDLRLKRCMFSWDLKDEDKNPVPLNDMSINSLPNDVALSLINSYDSATALKDEDRKN